MGNMMNLNILRPPIRGGLVSGNMKGMPNMQFMNMIPGMKPFGQLMPGNQAAFLNNNGNLMGQDSDEQGVQYKKMHKMNNYKKQNDFQESFVVFKNYHVVRDFIEVLQNVCIS